MRSRSCRCVCRGLFTTVQRGCASSYNYPGRGRGLGAPRRSSTASCEHEIPCRVGPNSRVGNTFEGLLMGGRLRISRCMGGRGQQLELVCSPALVAAKIVCWCRHEVCARELVGAWGLFEATSATWHTSAKVDAMGPALRCEAAGDTARQPEGNQPVDACECLCVFVQCLCTCVLFPDPGPLRV